MVTRAHRRQRQLLSSAALFLAAGIANTFIGDGVHGIEDVLSGWHNPPQIADDYSYDGGSYASSVDYSYRDGDAYTFDRGPK